LPNLQKQPLLPAALSSTTNQQQQTTGTLHAQAPSNHSNAVFKKPHENKNSPLNAVREACCQVSQGAISCKVQQPSCNLLIRSCAGLRQRYSKAAGSSC
jgi:hypothetical protein